MKKRRDSISNGSKIEALRKRAAALKEAIAAEQVREQKKAFRDRAREFSIIGEALVGNAEESPGFKLMLEQVMAPSITDARVRHFLKERGWKL